MLDEDMAEATDDDLHQAADRLGVVLIGQPTRSYFSLASRVRRGDADFWLRVRRADLLTWSANRFGYMDSAAIMGVPKPTVLDSAQWQDGPHGIRAELLTYVADAAVSSSIYLKTLPNLPDSWWSSLRDALKNLAATPTQRDTAQVLGDIPYLRRFYGVELPAPIDWATEHEDAHWANVTGPNLHILDWDCWGRQPAGFTAAGLYCTALGVPEVSDRLRHELAEVLDTPSGKWSILYHVWYRRKAMPSFSAWERGAAVARKILKELDIDRPQFS